MTSGWQAAVEHGWRLFRAGKAFEAHEAWEASWRRAVGVQRRVLQVLVLWAAAYHQAARGQRAGAARLLRKALERLSQGPIDPTGLDEDELRDALTASWEALDERRDHPDLTPPTWAPWPTEGVGTRQVDLALQTRCPYCGELVALEVEPELTGGAEYVEDCPVCCRPWRVLIRVEARDVRLSLHRQSD